MIALPKGCTVPFTIAIDISDLTEEMIEWYELIGGTRFVKDYYDHRGGLKKQIFVQYGRSKPCHYYQGGANHIDAKVRLQFHGDDAATASVFIMKFFEHVVSTNLKEQMERAAEGFSNI